MGERFGRSFVNATLALCVLAVALYTGRQTVVASHDGDYYSAVMADSPQSYWRLGSSGGADSAGNMNGVWQDTVTAEATAAGIFADSGTQLASAFPNTSKGYYLLPSGYDDFTTGLTIEAWIYPTVAADYDSMVSLGNAGSVGTVTFRRLSNNTLELGGEILQFVD